MFSYAKSDIISLTDTEIYTWFHKLSHKSIVIACLLLDNFHFLFVLKFELGMRSGMQYWNINKLIQSLRRGTVHFDWLIKKNYSFITSPACYFNCFRKQNNIILPLLFSYVWASMRPLNINKKYYAWLLKSIIIWTWVWYTFRKQLIVNYLFNTFQRHSHHNPDVISHVARHRKYRPEEKSCHVTATKHGGKCYNSICWFITRYVEL